MCLYTMDLSVRVSLLHLQGVASALLSASQCPTPLLLQNSSSPEWPLLEVLSLSLPRHGEPYKHMTHELARRHKLGTC